MLTHMIRSYSTILKTRSLEYMLRKNPGAKNTLALLRV